MIFTNKLIDEMMISSYKTYYHRNLPHYQPIDHTFFITFRLTDSLPIKIISQLKAERQKELKLLAEYTNIKIRKEKYMNYQSQYFLKFDKLLVQNTSGPHWLNINDIAKTVCDEIVCGDGTDYDLIAYSVMPNHVHIVFTPIINQSKTIDRKRTYKKCPASFYLVTKILQVLKSKTALKCNKLLKRSGTFWHHESYDHVVRNNDELVKIVNYTLANPVKAGLADNWEEWKWNYYNPNYIVQ